MKIRFRMVENNMPPTIAVPTEWRPSSRSGREVERKDAKNECERSHQNRAQA